MSEEWNDINGFPGYQVSSLGRVRSFRNRGGWGIEESHHPMRPSMDSYGYPIVSLCKDGRSATKTVHRLVAMAFVPNPEGKPQVNHKSGIKTDNAASNLEWVTCKENIVHSFHVLHTPPVRGEQNGQTKLADKEVARIRVLYAQRDERGKKKYTYFDLADMFDVCYSTIGYIVRGDSRKVLENG